MGLSTRLTRNDSSIRPQRHLQMGAKPANPSSPLRTENLWANHFVLFRVSPDLAEYSFGHRVRLPAVSCHARASDPIASLNDFQDPLTSAYSSTTPPSRDEPTPTDNVQHQESETSHAAGSTDAEAQQGDDNIKQASSLLSAGAMEDK